MVRLEEDTTDFGIKFEGGRKDAQKVGTWFRRVKEVAEAFMRERHDAENCRAAERHAKVAAAPPTVGISTRRGEGGREEGGGERGRHAQETEVWVWPSSSRNLWAFQWPSQESVRPLLRHVAFSPQCH